MRKVTYIAGNQPRVMKGSIKRIGLELTIDRSEGTPKRLKSDRSGGSFFEHSKTSLFANYSEQQSYAFPPLIVLVPKVAKLVPRVGRILDVPELVSKMLFGRMKYRSIQ